VVDPQIAAAANDILQDVVLYGTGTAANLGRPQIGKTGTDDNHDNAWFVGAVPQLSAAVWVGFHQGQIPMEPPRTRITVFGGTWPAQIWRLLMQKVTRSLPPEPFPTPEVSYVSVAIDTTHQPACLPSRGRPDGDPHAELGRGDIARTRAGRAAVLDRREEPRRLLVPDRPAGQIHVPDTQAPRVISMVGTMLNLVNEVLQSAVGNYFRNTLQGLPAVQFIETRQEVQDKAERYITEYLGSTTSWMYTPLVST
jgi:membrane peptidoglycan carboxypeptidase